MSKSFKLVAVLSFAIAASAGAQEKPGAKPAPVQKSGPAREVSFEEIKDRCMHPEQTDIQRAPQHIVVQCTDTRTSWVAAAPGSVGLRSTRKVMSQLVAEKFFVPAMDKEHPVTSKEGSCLRFKEVQETLTIERPLSCGEVLGIKSDLDEYCATQTDATKGGNSKLAEVVETGNVIDTCGVSSSQGTQK